MVPEQYELSVTSEQALSGQHEFVLQSELESGKDRSRWPSPKSERKSLLVKKLLLPEDEEESIEELFSPWWCQCHRQFIFLITVIPGTKASAFVRS
jgi:hypothetical protein